MKNELKEILVNMPDCTNLLFTFDNNIIVKKKIIASNDEKNAILYSKLSIDIQCSIDKFLNPKAI